MSELFCVNRLCRCSVKCPPEQNRLRYMEANGDMVEVERRKIIDAATKKEFDFCEICANAVALVNQK